MFKSPVDDDLHVSEGLNHQLRNLRYRYGSIPINTIFRGMNIHLPAILMFTRGTRFWHAAIYTWKMMFDGWLYSWGFSYAMNCWTLLNGDRKSGLRDIANYWQTIWIGFIENITGKPGFHLRHTIQGGWAKNSRGWIAFFFLRSGWLFRLNGIDLTSKHARWCPPSYKLVYNPINYRYITYKP